MAHEGVVESTPTPIEKEVYGQARSSEDTLGDENLTAVATEAEAGLGEEKLTKATSKASVNDLASIPNGGLRAWLQVLGVFILFFNTWGMTGTFGAYQTFYESGSLFHSTSSNISWIGSIQSFLLLLVGTLTGPVYDAGYVPHLVWTGSVTIVFGQMMLSLSHQYWQALLAQAVCMGIGSGCLFVPGVAILSTYFNTRLALAVGLAASGSGLGGVIYPIIFHKLEPQIGFAWTTRVIGFIMLATQVIPLAVLKIRVLPAKVRKLVDWSAFTELPYVFFLIGGLAGFMGLYIPFFYIQYYAISSHITNDNLGFYLLPILNTASVMGRVVPNVFADRTGPFNMIIPCLFVSGVITFALNGTHNLGGMIVNSLLYGFFSGTFVSLPPACFVSLSPNRGILGTRMGMGFAVTGIGGLIGSPIAGAILSSSGWVGLWCFSASLICAGSMLVFVSRMFKSKWKLVAKI